MYRIIHTDHNNIVLLSIFTPHFLLLTLRLCLTASLRAELNHLHAAAIEHLKQIHLKENSAAKRELEKAIEASHQQVIVMVSSVFIFFVCLYDPVIVKSSSN